MEVKLDLRWIVIAWLFGSFPDVSTAATIDRLIRIQPIQVCSDDGTLCANTNRILFEAETRKIWSQAGIRVEFLPWNTFRGTPWLNLGVSLFNDNYSVFTLANTPGHGQHPDPKVINVWFVQSIGNGGYYGHSWQTVPGVVERNGVAVANNVFASYSGVDRLDVIAHEMGHNLGLDHDTFGAGGANNVMSSDRQVPASLGEIYPDGQLLDQLTVDQIAQARSSSLVGLLPPKLTIEAVTNKVVVSWLQQSGFVLESAPAVTGLWTQASSHTSPHVITPDQTNRFFRLRK